MGKFGIGARVRDRDGDLAEVIGKPEKGWREVRILGGKCDGMAYWAPKSELEVVEAGWQVEGGKITGVAGSEINFGDAVMSLVSEPQFEVGQRVICVDNDGAPNDYNVGEVYSVASLAGAADEDALVNCAGIDAGMFAYRFKPFTLEAGKFYRTRDGRKVGPMEIWHEDVEHRWQQDGESFNYSVGGDLWRNDGTSEYGMPDIVAEWVEPAVPADAETIVVEDATDPVWVPAVGDKIRWLGKFDARMLTPGNVYEIKLMNDDGWVGITDNDQDRGNHSWDVADLVDKFELVAPQPKFKVGDIVNYVLDGKHPDAWQGTTITSIETNDGITLYHGTHPTNGEGAFYEDWIIPAPALPAVGTEIIITGTVSGSQLNGGNVSVTFDTATGRRSFDVPASSIRLAA